MDYFGKALWTTVGIGFGLLGFFTGLLIVKVAIDVAGVLLGSSLGTILLAFVLYELYKHNKDKFNFKN